MIIFSSFKVGMNFLIKACFFLHFKKLLRKFEFLFYFFPYFKLIFFFDIFVLFWCDDRPKEPYPTKFEFPTGAGHNVDGSCQRWWSYAKQNPMLMGHAGVMTQRWRVLVAAGPKTDGSTSSSTQLKWVMLSAGPKAIWIPLGAGPNAIRSCWNKTWQWWVRM
jgi:hypothetical protein